MKVKVIETYESTIEVNPNLTYDERRTNAINQVKRLVVKPIRISVDYEERLVVRECNE